jgi:hypothetical protein
MDTKTKTTGVSRKRQHSNTLKDVAESVIVNLQGAFA